MKNISLKMTDNFKISLLSRENIYELENNASLLSIECDVKPELEYKLHIQHKDTKNLMIMDKQEDGISKMLTAEYFPEDGTYYIQLEGSNPETNYRIESNKIRLEIGSFINAENIPAPMGGSAYDDVIIHIHRIERDISSLRDSKQDKLIAGENITINANVISSTAKGYEYTAGDNINISDDNVISAIVPTKTSELTNDSDYISGSEVSSLIEIETNARTEADSQLESQISDVNTKLDTKQDKSAMSDYALKTDIPTVPTDVSAFNNDAGYITNAALTDYAKTADLDALGEVVDTKADKDITDALETRVNTLDNETLDIYQKLETKANSSEVYSKEQSDALLNQKASTGEVSALNTNLRAEIAKKQNTLTAGENITIENDVISSTAAGDVTKAYLEEHYYDKPFFADISTLDIQDDRTTIKLVTEDDIIDVETLVENDSPSVYSFVEESDISYYAIASYCGKWLDGRDRKHRVYVVTSGIGKGNTVRIADKPSDMDLLISLSATVVGAAAAKNVMTNSDILTYVNDEGIFAVNNFTGYADRMYIFMEYVVKGA